MREAKQWKLDAPMPGFSEDEYRQQFDLSHTSQTPAEVFSRELRKDADTFIVVAAQNATPVDPDFWAILVEIAADTNAELVVIPYCYKNATSLWSTSQRNAHIWAAEVRPYLYNQRLKLNDNLTVMADIPIQPTNGNPLGRTESMSGVQSAIFGHAKLQMKTIPTPGKRMAKLMTTTGTCTQENYTITGLGKISQFHHSLSAAYVELDGDKFYMTQLHFDKVTKSVTNLNKRYTTAYGCRPAPRALALIGGDEHVRFADPQVLAARNELLEQTDPLHRVFHDTLDSYSCSPHHRDHPFIYQEKSYAGYGNVREEVEQALDYIKTNTTKRRKSIIVPSNHDDMLYRWLEHHKKTGCATLAKENAEYFHELALKVSRASSFDVTKGAVIPDPLGLLIRERKLKNVLALEQDQDFSLAEVLLSMHGHLGPNGARGSRLNLRRIGVKSIIGHSHCPGIEEGCTQSGTSTFLRLEYNHGASGWLNADVLLNADGKRQVIIYISGRYRRPRD